MVFIIWAYNRDMVLQIIYKLEDIEEKCIQNEYFSIIENIFFLSASLAWTSNTNARVGDQPQVAFIYAHAIELSRHWPL